MADLADPRRCDEPCSELRISGTTPFYMLHGGLHSAETGSPEMLMELAYRLAVSNAPHIREIRDKLVVLINPVAEPDGRDRDGRLVLPPPEGQDELRRAAARSRRPTGASTSATTTTATASRGSSRSPAPPRTRSSKWHPIVVHDLHESVPLLSIWTGTGPYNVNLEPSIFSEWHAIAFHEVAAFAGLGMPGVWTYGFGEGWAHLYADSVAINHNALGRGYETFGNGTAETVERFARSRAQQVHGPARDRAGLVPHGPAPAEAALVAAQQHELHGDRGADRAPVRRPQLGRHAAQLLPARRELAAQGRHREALRGGDSRRRRPIDAAWPTSSTCCGSTASRSRGRARRSGARNASTRPAPIS